MIRTPGFPRLRRREGMTLIELCIVIVILGVLLVVAVAALMRARVVANESAAMGVLRTVTKAQLAYFAECGRGGYAMSLRQLGTVRPGRDVNYLAEDIGLVDMPERNGYRFNMRPGTDAEVALTDCVGVPTRTTYYISAIPTIVGRTGSRSFAASQRNGIWALPGGNPPREPLGPPAQYAQ